MAVIIVTYVLVVLFLLGAVLHRPEGGSRPVRAEPKTGEGHK